MSANLKDLDSKILDLRNRLNEAASQDSVNAGAINKMNAKLNRLSAKHTALANGSMVDVSATHVGKGKHAGKAKQQGVKQKHAGKAKQQGVKHHGKAKQQGVKHHGKAKQQGVKHAGKAKQQGKAKHHAAH